jgi:hypothetical protein
MNVSISIADGPDQAVHSGLGAAALNDASANGSVSVGHDDTHANDAGAPAADLVREVEAALALLTTSQSATADNALGASDAGAAPS